MRTAAAIKSRDAQHSRLGNTLILYYIITTLVRLEKINLISLSNRRSGSERSWH